MSLRWPRYWANLSWKTPETAWKLLLRSMVERDAESKLELMMWSSVTAPATNSLNWAVKNLAANRNVVKNIMYVIALAQKIEFVIYQLPDWGLLDLWTLWCVSARGLSFELEHASQPESRVQLHQWFSLLKVVSVWESGGKVNFFSRYKMAPLNTLSSLWWNRRKVAAGD